MTHMQRSHTAAQHGEHRQNTQIATPTALSNNLLHYTTQYLVDVERGKQVLEHRGEELLALLELGGLCVAEAVEDNLTCTTPSQKSAMNVEVQWRQYLI